MSDQVQRESDTERAMGSKEDQVESTLDKLAAKQAKRLGEGQEWFLSSEVLRGARPGQFKLCQSTSFRGTRLVLETWLEAVEGQAEAEGVKEDLAGLAAREAGRVG